MGNRLNEVKSANSAVGVVYNPRETPFLKAARDRGLRHAGGLGMLARQGAHSLSLWLRVAPDIDLMRLAAGLRDAGAETGALAQQGEAERLRAAAVLTTTFQTAEEQLNQFVQDPRASIEKRVAMADIRGRFG